MDEDRSPENIRNAAITELPTRGEEKPREPRKRFVGRRTAVERVSPKNDLNGTIEETGVVEGETQDLKFTADNCC